MLSFDKKKNQFWNKDISLALLIALTLHLIGITVFHIDLKGFLNPTKYPPTFLVSTEPLHVAEGFYEEKITAPDIPSFLTIEQPEAPSLSLSSFALQMAPKPQPIHLQELDLSSPYRATTSHYYLSGGHRFREEPRCITGKKICKAELEFKAAPDTGIIFWLNWRQATGDSKCDQEIVNELKKTRLIGSERALALEGIIEIEFGS